MEGGRGRRLLHWPRRDRARIGADVDTEIGFHLAMRVEELMSQGASESEARRQAEREFGDIRRARAELIDNDARVERRRSWGDAVIDAARDVRIAARGLGRAPLFTVVVIATLGLGIGANTALFSVVDGVVLKPLPYRDPDALVAVSPEQAFLNAEYVLVREGARAYEQLAGYRPGVGFSVSGVGEPVRVTGARVTANLFDALGVHPAQGRGFVAADEQQGAEPVVVLSEGLWQELFGGARTAVGGRLTIDGMTHTIAGVMPAWFAFPSAQTRLWVPLVLDPTTVGSYWGVGGTRAVGRLRRGVTAEAARRELVGFGELLRRANPLWTPNAPYRDGVTVQPLRERMITSSPCAACATPDARGPGARGMLLVLLGATMCVLLIACANVGNLYLVRVLGRERDLAIRAALGGGRPHILRAIALESVLLALAGGAAGIVVGYLALRGLLPLLPADFPRLEQVRLDGRVLGFAVCATLFAALLFSLLPAVRLLSGRAPGALREGPRGGGESRRIRQLSRTVVIAEVALSVVLLLAASLLLRTLDRLHAIDPGFRTHGVLAARISPPDPLEGQRSPERLRAERSSRIAFYDRVTERVRAAPGIAAVGLTGQLPFDGEFVGTAAAVEHVTLDPNDLPVFDFRPVSSDYFAVLELPLLEGRTFTGADRDGALPVAIVDAAAAQRFWPGQSALGKRIGRPWLREWLTVVGVVGSVRNNDLLAEPLPALYVPFAQQPRAAATLVVRTERPPTDVSAVIRSAVRETAASVPVAPARPLGEFVRDSVATSRSLALLLGTFAAIALALGALGIYGVLAYSVQRRSRELGVRLALGATTGEVRALVLRDGALLLGLGLVTGLPFALALGRTLRGLLYGVSATDPASLLVVPVVLAAAGLLAAYLPAARASRVDPAHALRSD